MQYFDAMLERIRKDNAKRLLAAALKLQAEHKADLSTSYPRASVKGEFPHGRTWNLRDSVTVDPASVNGILDNGGWVRVGYLRNAWYILALSKIGRLTIKDTTRRIRSTLERIIKGS